VFLPEVSLWRQDTLRSDDNFKTDAKATEVSENQVLNYTMVQVRLLPLLAATFALHFTGRGMMALYQENQQEMQQEKLLRRAEGLVPKNCSQVQIYLQISIQHHVV